MVLYLNQLQYPSLSHLNSTEEDENVKKCLQTVAWTCKQIRWQATGNWENSLNSQAFSISWKNTKQNSQTAHNFPPFNVFAKGTVVKHI